MNIIYNLDQARDHFKENPGVACLLSPDDDARTLLEARCFEEAYDYFTKGKSSLTCSCEPSVDNYTDGGSRIEFGGSNTGTISDDNSDDFNDFFLMNSTPMSSWQLNQLRQIERKASKLLNLLNEIYRNQRLNDLSKKSLDNACKSLHESVLWAREIFK